MYPPRKSPEQSLKAKFTYNAVTKPAVPSHKDIDKINKILDNAKKYEKEKQTKKDFMMQGLNTIKKKQSVDKREEDQKARVQSKESKGERTSSKALPKNIYQKVDRKDRNNSSSSSKNRDSDSSRRSNPKSPRNLITVSSEGNISKKMMAPNTHERISSKQTTKQRQESTKNKYEQTNQQPMFKCTQSASIAAEISPKHTQSSYNSGRYDQVVYAERNSERRGEKGHSAQGSYKPYNTESNLFQNGNSKYENYQSQSSRISENFGYGGPTRQETKPDYNTYSQDRRPVYESKKYSQPSNIQNKSTISQADPRKIQPASSQFGKMTSTISQKNREDGNSNNQLRNQLERIIVQSEELRAKYYKTQEDKSSLQQKNKLLEKQHRQLRRQNEDLKVRSKFLEAEAEKANAYRENVQGQMRQSSEMNQRNYQELIEKVNDLNSQLRNKASQLQRNDREMEELREIAERKQAEIERLKSIISIKDDEVLDLHEQKYQNNKIFRSVGIESELKKQKQRREELQAEINRVRRQNVDGAKAEAQLHRSRKEIQHLRTNLRNVEEDLSRANQIIRQFNQNGVNGSADGRVEMLEKQLQSLSKSKAMLSHDYERRLMEKQQEIEYLESKEYDKILQQKTKYAQSKEQSFQAVIKEHVEAINSLKQENIQKTNEYFSIKMQLEALKAQLQNANNTSKMLAIQVNSMKANETNIIEARQKMQGNEVNSLNRTISQLTDTLERKKREVKEKDKFIESYLVNVSSKEDIQMVIAQLQKILHVQ